MFMTQRIRNDARNHSGRFVPAYSKRPADFEETFIRIGRYACEEHYGVGKRTVNDWLEKCGKDRLIRLRAEHCAKNGRIGANAIQLLGRERVNKLRGDKLTRKEAAKILEQAFPVEPQFTEIARLAAQHLRIKRNGGFAVSPMMAGGWMVGLKRMSSVELIEMAKKRGFAPSLTDEGQADG